MSSFQSEYLQEQHDRTQMRLHSRGQHLLSSSPLLGKDFPGITTRRNTSEGSIIMTAAQLKRQPLSTPQSTGLAIGLKNAARDRYADLVNSISFNSTIGQRILIKLDRLREAFPLDIRPWFALWHEHCDHYFDLSTAEEILSGTIPAGSGFRLFLAHSYCKIVLTELVYLASPSPKVGADRRSLYDWVECIGDEELAALRSELRLQAEKNTDLARLSVIECSDLLATIYQEILPPPLRHLLGEYYTPSWLVEYCISHAERHQQKIKDGLTILDPAAGSGSFLAHYIAHLSTRPTKAVVKIVGFDVNPLAVDFCYANTSLAILKAECDAAATSFSLCVHLADAVVDPTVEAEGPLFGVSSCARKKILDVVFSDGQSLDADLNRALKPFVAASKGHVQFRETLSQYVVDAFGATHKTGANIVVGNPPWITWDGLAPGYRDTVAPQWSSSALVTNTGWKAKVAAGKTDFSSLFVYRAAQRHAALNAAMVFVLPLSLFQSRLAGAGFRTFTTAEGRSFPSVEIDDFSDVKVFPDAVNRTSVGTFLVGRSPQYPIPYRTWRAGPTGSGRLECVTGLGGPLDPTESNSPIVGFDEGLSGLQTLVGKSDYRARGGVNTGGANTILWLEVLERTETLSTVRNVGKSRRGASPVIVADVENGAVYPLLCGTDMRRWKAVPGKSLLLLYSEDQPKKALPEAVVKERFPKAFDFVSQFKNELAGRKEYHRWGCSGPFYEVYRIGPYTFSPIKVVWQHTGYRKALNVSVLDDRERQTVIPDQKAIIIPFEDLQEAHYACAFLSSSVTAGLLDRYLGTDASTHILDYVALRRFSQRNADHVKLAELSVSAHGAAADNRPLVEIEHEIDAIMATLLRKE
jgi:hypothetical protein